ARAPRGPHARRVQQDASREECRRSGQSACGLRSERRHRTGTFTDHTSAVGDGLLAPARTRHIFLAAPDPDVRFFSAPTPLTRSRPSGRPVNERLTVLPVPLSCIELISASIFGFLPAV